MDKEKETEEQKQDKEKEKEKQEEQKKNKELDWRDIRFKNIVQIGILNEAYKKAVKQRKVNRYAK
ncbi:MAG: hypothetical protein WC516_04820 [Patescibacteria group bacterium]